MQPDKLLHLLTSKCLYHILFPIIGAEWLALMAVLAIGLLWELFWHVKDNKPVSRADMVFNLIGGVLGLLSREYIG